MYSLLSFYSPDVWPTNTAHRGKFAHSHLYSLDYGIVDESNTWPLLKDSITRRFNYSNFPRSRHIVVLCELVFEIESYVLLIIIKGIYVKSCRIWQSSSNETFHLKNQLNYCKKVEVQHYDGELSGFGQTVKRGIRPIYRAHCTFVCVKA